MPVVYHTSYFALVYRAPVQAGQTVLVHGAAGGVGVSAVQIAKALGARVLATAGSPEKREFAKRQGADEVFDSRDTSWVQDVMRATNNRGADHMAARKMLAAQTPLTPEQASDESFDLKKLALGR